MNVGLFLMVGRAAVTLKQVFVLSRDVRLKRCSFRLDFGGHCIDLGREETHWRIKII